MDEDKINSLVQACKLLKYKFFCVFAADIVSLNLSQNKFIIVSVSKSGSIGAYWNLLCRKNGNQFFVDPHGQKLTLYKIFV